MLYSQAERRPTERNNVPVPRPSSRPIDKGRLSSVATSVRLLKAFSEEQVEIGISDLAKRLGVAKSTAEGQAILAFQPADVLERVVRDGLSPRTPQTITDPLALKKVLEAVRLRGCAIEDEESELGMRCIAAPLRNDAGEVVAAIG